MEFHEIANLFPMMQPEEFDQLKQDIKANGLIEPIITFEGMILDGRNRWLACGEVETYPRFEEYEGDQPVSYVISKNLHRRNLNKSQRAGIGWEAKEPLADEAKKRQLSGLLQFQDTVLELVPEREKGNARDLAGEAVGVSGRYIDDFGKIVSEAPEYKEPIMSGEMTITQAKREITKQQTKEYVELPDAKYRVIYADPPWQYGNTMPDNFGEQRDHYRTMTMTELCLMPVKNIVENNAVLFLWVTSPILEESFELIKAWGFKYKASFVWDKIKHVMGHYNSVRHELLLVCTRGSCQPDVKKLFDSVVSIERTEHSVKPEEFRDIIDTIYPYGKRIELFARDEAEGWDVYGNEV